MIPPEGQEKIELAAQEKYEEVLGITLDDERQKINEVHLRLAHRFREYAEVKEALSKAKTILVAENNVEKGRRLSKIGKEKEALPYLKEAVRLRGDWVDCNWLGSTLNQLDRYKEALPYLRKAVELQSDWSNYHWLGATLVKLGRRKEALPYLRKAVELQSDWLNYRWLGATLVKLGRRKEALPYLRKAVESRGNDLDCYWLGKTLAQLGKHKEALPYLRKVGDRAEPALYSPFRQRVFLHWSRFTAIVIPIIISWPFRLLAMVSTALVLWHLNNIFITVLVIAASFLFILALRKGDDNTWYDVASIFIPLWGSYSASMYLVLDRFTPLWSWACITLGVIAGLGLSFYPGIYLFDAIIEKLDRPNMWKCAGVFCVLFMLIFGLANLLLAEVPVTEIASSALSYIENNNWLFSVLALVLVFILGSVFAGFYSGAIFSGSEWYREWDNASEASFCFGLMATILTTITVLELIFYVSFIREYIGGVWDVAIGISEPLTKYLREVLLYYGVSCILAIPLYLIFVSIAKGITRKEHLPLIVRIPASILSVWVSISLIVPAIGLQLPAEAGLAAFLNGIIGSK